MGISREDVVRKLAELFSSVSDAEVVILFGSTARGCSHPHDIDIAVKFSGEKSLLDLAELVSKVAEYLGIPEDLIDIVDLNTAKPALLMRVLKEGIVLKGDPKALRRLYEEAFRGADQLIEVRMWAIMDPEPKTDKAILVSRAEEVRRNARFIENEILVEGVSELTYKDILALERAVHRIAEAMLDVCRHLIAVHSLGLAESYGEYPKKLMRGGLMPRELAEDVARLAGLRNILVHRYLEVDPERLYEAAQRIVKDIAPRFLNWVKEIDP